MFRFLIVFHRRLNIRVNAHRIEVVCPIMPESEGSFLDGLCLTVEIPLIQHREQRRDGWTGVRLEKRAALSTTLRNPNAFSIVRKLNSDFQALNPSKITSTLKK